MIQRLGKDSILYFLGKFTSAIFAYLTIILFIRIAGNEVYGKYSLILSIILFTVTFSGGWINQIILRFRAEAREHSQKNDFILAISFFSTLSLLAGSIAIFLILQNTPEVSNLIITLSVLCYIFIFSYSIKLTVLQIEIKVKKYIIIELIRSILIILLPICFYIFFKKITIEVIIFSILISYILLVVFTRTDWEFPFQKIIRLPSIKRIKLYRNYGIPIGFFLGIVYLLNVLDRYLITYFLGYESAGIYSAVYDIIYKSLGLLYVPILTAAHPLVMNSWISDKNETFKILNKSIKYELVILPLAMIGIIVLSPLLAQTLKIDLTLFLKISLPLSVSAFLWQISMLLHKPLELNNKSYLMLIFALASLLIGTLLNITLIPYFGYTIVAYISILSASVYAFIVGFRYIKHL